jgi:DNA-binding NarL/FixJ family response regulator
MDFELPDGSGAQATREILRENPNCKIIILTVHANDDKLIDAVRSGAVGYILKGRPIDDLLASLHSVWKGEAAVSRTMTRRIMEELAYNECESSYPKDELANLTWREKEILRELISGSSNGEIASRLFISQNTVKHHIHSIYGKLEIRSRREAVEYARRYGLIPAG